MRFDSRPSLLLVALAAFLAILTTLTMADAQPSGTASERAVLQSFKSSPAAANWKDEGAVLQQAQGEQARTSFTVLLKQRNLDQLEKLTMEVSDPRSDRYGKFMTPAEISALTNPPQADQDRVVAWLKQGLTLASATDLDNRGDMIKIHNVLVSEVEKLFGCTMHRFTEQAPPAGVSGIMPQPAFEARTVYRCVGDLTIPADLRDVITGTLGVAEFPPRYHGGPHPHPVGGGAGKPAVTPLRRGAEHAHNQPNHPDNDKQHSQAADNQPPTKEFHVPVAHPHRTLRTPQQLATVAAEFNRERPL